MAITTRTKSQKAPARPDKLRVTSLASWYGSNRTLAEAAARATGAGAEGGGT